MEQRLIERIGLVLVHSRERGARYARAAKVVKLGRLSRQVTDDIAQAGAAGELPQTECNEL